MGTIDKLAMQECIDSLYEVGCSGYVMADMRRLIERLRREGWLEQDIRDAADEALRVCDEKHVGGGQHQLRLTDAAQAIAELIP